MVPNDESIHLGHRGVMNLVPYQLDPAIQALRQPRARILIADAVGLGKTLEAGVLATELIQRGRGKRILVVTQKSMLTQFQKEWWSRFSIPLVRLDSVGLARVRNRIPANHNPFNHFDRSIISIDTLKSNLEYRNYLENAWWDIIVIDECHNVAARAGESGVSRRARLARLLATRSDTLMLLSATPHDGSARSFASLMSLLDPTAISDPDDYTPDDFKSKGLVVRRFKKDIRDQVTADFQERITTCLPQSASPQEEAIYSALLAIRFTQGGQHKGGKQQELQRVGLQKGLFSSPAAALESTLKRIELLQAKVSGTTDEANEIQDLNRLVDALKIVTTDPKAEAFSKYQRLLSYLRSPEFGWQKTDATDRLVIFSERIETLRWLQQQLGEDLKLKATQLELLHGQMADTEQQALVERFGRKDDPIRVLLCSDVASEGLNLHYFCHRLVHFDMPWSLMVFQQRNGRVDRYGQKKQPKILYPMTDSSNEKIRVGLRILEILDKKGAQAAINLGDPSEVFCVFDSNKEVDKVTNFIADGLTAEQVEVEMDKAIAIEQKSGANWMMDWFGGGAIPTNDSLSNINAPKSMFKSDFHYAQAALNQINLPQAICQWTSHEPERTITITAPTDLRDRLRQLPREAQADNDLYGLCDDPIRIATEIETARQAKAEDDTWPKLHYLWPQHPVMEWLGDRVLTYFGRHSAPVMQSANIAQGELAFILMSLVPNRKGQPLLVEWRVATKTIGATTFTLEPFETFVQRAGIAAGALPNRNQTAELKTESMKLQANLPDAVAAMRAHMMQLQNNFAQASNQKLEGTLQELERLQNRQIEQLTLRLQSQIETVKRSKFERRSLQIGRVFDDYRQWVRDTLTTEPQPWIQVLAAVCNPTTGA